MPNGSDEVAHRAGADRLDWHGPTFSARTRRVAYAALEALLSDEDDTGALIPGPPAVCERGVSAFADAAGRSSPDLRRGFAVLSFFLDMLPLVVIFTPSRMVNLPLARRVAYFEALESSRFGLFAMLIVAFKVPMCIPAFEDPAELAATGFDRADLTTPRKLPMLRASA